MARSDFCHDFQLFGVHTGQFIQPGMGAAYHLAELVAALLKALLALAGLAKKASFSSSSCIWSISSSFAFIWGLNRSGAVSA
jgi:hypothetical protein